MGNAWRRPEVQQQQWWRALLCGCAGEAPQPIYQQLITQQTPTPEELHTMVLEIIQEIERMKNTCCCGRDVEGYMQMRPFPPPRLPDQEAIYEEWLQERLECEEPW